VSLIDKIIATLDYEADADPVVTAAAQGVSGRSTTFTMSDVERLL
jgi:hypothetical protein